MGVMTWTLACLYFCSSYSLDKVQITFCSSTSVSQIMTKITSDWVCLFPLKLRTIRYKILEKLVT